MVMGGDSCSKGHGFDPSTGWTFYTYICCKTCIVCLKKTKSPGMVKFKKNITSKIFWPIPRFKYPF